MGHVKDAEGTVLKAGDRVITLEDISSVKEGLKIKNTIPKGTVLKVTGLPTDENRIQATYENSEWAVTAHRVKKI